MQIGQGIRQGDVLLVKVAEAPNVTLVERKRDASGRLVVEYGETTGHAHAVLERDAVLYDIVLEAERIAGQVLQVAKPATIVHEEHGPHTIEEGVYERWLQMEYDPEEERRVRD